MALLQAVLIGLVALLIAPGAFFYFDVTPKLLVVLLAPVALALVRAATRFGSMPQPKTGRPSAFSLLLLFTLASLILSTALSPKPSLSLYGSTWRRYGLVAQFA